MDATAKRKPTSFDELYPGRFLKAGNFGGRRVTLTIKDVDIEELEGEDGKKVKAVLSFAETPLQYVLAKINGRCLKAMFGASLEKWIGKRVTWFPTTDFAPMKRDEPCIRVWGSPDIERDIDVEIPMPRRRAIRMTMHRTEPRGRVAPSPQPVDDADPNSDGR